MKKTFRYLLKGILAFVAFLLVTFIVLKLVYNDDIPKGIPGTPADEMAFKLLDAIHHKEFTEAKEIHWTFRGDHRYEWKLQQNMVAVYWEDYRVLYQTQYPEISFAFKNGKRLEGEEQQAAIDDAAFHFNNDSFWVVAPHKIFDIGTTRELVEENGKQKLLVTYHSGGTTPGDSYLWEVDENYQPIAFKMWVRIIPLDGIEVTWSNWEMTAGGFPLSRKRSLFGIEVPVTDLKVIP